MATPNNVYLFARAVLDAVNAHWPAPGDAEALPDRQYVTFGNPAWDCEQVVCSVQRMFSVESDVAAEQIISGPLFFMRGIAVAVSIIRCVPVPDDSGDVILLPSDTELEAAAQIALVDSEAIFNALVEAQLAGELAGCSGIAFDNWVAEGPEGGLGGGTQHVRLAMF